MSVGPPSGRRAQGSDAPAPRDADLAGAMKYGHRTSATCSSAPALARRPAVAVAAWPSAAGGIRDHDLSHVTRSAASERPSTRDAWTRSSSARRPRRSLRSCGDEGPSSRPSTTRRPGRTLVASSRSSPSAVRRARLLRAVDRRLDGRLARLLRIQAIRRRAGLGFEQRGALASAVHDEILSTRQWLSTLDNNAEASRWVTNASRDRACRHEAALDAADAPQIGRFATRSVEAVVERSDVCAVPAPASWRGDDGDRPGQRVPREIGGDSIDEIRRNHTATSKA